MQPLSNKDSLEKYSFLKSKLKAYKDLVDENLLNEIDILARQLQNFRVIHYNTTAKGGGVAAMIKSLLPIMNELGIKHYSKVIHLDNFGCLFMAKLSELIQGGGVGELTKAERDLFVQGLTRSLEPISSDSADVYWIHDIQLLPVAQLQIDMRPIVWLNHVDTSRPNQDAEKFVRSYLSDYDMCVYNTPFSAFKSNCNNRFETISLGIDVFSNKNREMSLSEGKSVMKNCGIDVSRPVITQVARFGRFKNPWQAIDIYRCVKSKMPQVQLVLIGAMEANDDIEADGIYKDIRKYAGDDSDIHLLSNPEMLGDTQINAFQRFSAAIIQRSTREGFGLTVTEAMWKKQPVIGTSAIGFKSQIHHEKNGFIADDIETSAEYVIRLLKDRQLHKRLGLAAKEHVKRNFLLPIMVKDYLQLLRKVKGV